MTPIQSRFAEEYLVDLNATKAAIRSGYSAKTAEVKGSQLLRKPDIQVAIQARMKKRSERTDITADRVLAELAKIAFGDIRQIFTGEGHIRRIEDLDDDAAALLAAVETTTQRVRGSPRDDPEYETVSKFKLWDKRAALVDIGKHLGMFKDHVVHSGPNGGPIETRDMTKLTPEQLAAIAALDQGQ